MTRDKTDTAEANTVAGVEAGSETTRPDVECCIDNVDVDGRRAIEASAESVDVQYCLQRCGICYREPFFVVDGNVVTGEDHLTLLDSLDSEGSRDA